MGKVTGEDTEEGRLWGETAVADPAFLIHDPTHPLTKGRQNI